MRNNLFNISINPETGFIDSISHPYDKHSMNWCAEDGSWGRVHCLNRTVLQNPFRFAYEEMKLKSFSQSEASSEARYDNGKLSVTVTRSFTQSGNFSEMYTIKNYSDVPVSITRDNFGIELPFNDRYTYADECITNRCNTHIWCGHHFSYVNALRMGESDINLGLILTKGALDSYSQNGCKSNNRGVFVLEPESMILNANKEYTLSWELFWHKGDDFEECISKYPRYIGIDAAHYTVFDGEKIEFTVKANSDEIPGIYLNNKKIEASISDGAAVVSYSPESLGEHRFKIKTGDICTHADFLVKIPFAGLVENRINFIADNQQCLDKNSPLYGAYLVYDNKTESMYFDDSFADHNACRERLGMALLMAKYLQSKDNDKIRASLDLYIDFVLREFYDEESGEVYNTIGKNRDMIRLYNAPWVMVLFAEMYFLTKDKSYLQNIIKLAYNYYSLGGRKFYPNGIEIVNVLNAFRMAKMDAEYEVMYNYFSSHVDNMISVGLSYPRHEVNYEQTIVTPAATLVSEMGIVTDNKEYYAEHAAKHIECLTRFSHTQPSYHLNEIPIRYWDDYWFGKSMMFGDVYPHYWSCLSARSYICYGKLTGDKGWISKAEEVLRNCMCLYTDDGRGSCAYVYPHSLDGKNGEFYDEWANDQDFAMYFALCSADSINAFDLTFDM